MYNRVSVAHNPPLFCWFCDSQCTFFYSSACCFQIITFMHPSCQYCCCASQHQPDAFHYCHFISPASRAQTPYLVQVRIFQQTRVFMTTQKCAQRLTICSQLHSMVHRGPGEPWKQQIQLHPQRHSDL